MILEMLQGRNASRGNLEDNFNPNLRLFAKFLLLRARLEFWVELFQRAADLLKHFFDQSKFRLSEERYREFQPFDDQLINV